jgi:hypothetical protein
MTIRISSDATMALIVEVSSAGGVSRMMKS